LGNAAKVVLAPHEEWRDAEDGAKENENYG
jgi:hypothetical protein